MDYETWREAVFTVLGGSILVLSEEDYPNVDFYHMHRAHIAPRQAAQMAKLIQWFAKPSL